MLSVTPEYPKGRRVVVIANDITFKIGSFGPREDDYFYKATEIAKKRGLPRIYLSANSGARLGIAEELLNLFQAAFVDPADPLKGVKYLYLTPDTLATLAKKGSSVITEEIEEDGERRHRITDIVGLQDGLGVESLRGSGLIAGATSRAYDEGIFTISLVTARSVGIGAYLVRLGQRAIQVEGNPLILTGTQALNKVLGREVYTSNLQLGGTQIMARNGTTHLIAESDLDGALKVIKWLAYVPDRKGKAIPISPSQDSWDRPVTYSPPKGPYDPRWLIEGQEDEGLTGLFDKGSFFEVLGEWAKTIVCGRARLGGIPVGVIAVESEYRLVSTSFFVVLATDFAFLQLVSSSSHDRARRPRRPGEPLRLRAEDHGGWSGLDAQLSVQDRPGDQRHRPRGSPAHLPHQHARLLWRTAGHVR